MSMIVFLHLPKTAGTTFRFVLANSFGFRHCHIGYLDKPVVRQNDFDFARRIFPGMKSISGHNLAAPWGLTIPNPFFVTFLREPVARVFSHYQASVVEAGNDLDFERSLQREEHLSNLQVKLLAGKLNLDQAKRRLEQCNFVGLTEKFDLSLHALGRLSPLKLNLRYKRQRTAKVNAIKKSLERDLRMIELARDYNRLDLELYAFATQEVFPKLCARAGIRPNDPPPSCAVYSSVNQPRYLLHRLYNKLVFRELCKRYHSKHNEPPAEIAAEPV